MKLDDRLYLETDDACAICGLRGVSVLTIHHIDGNSGNNVYDNMIVLCHNCHHRYHQNKGISGQQITDRKRHLILKTLTQYGLNALKIADRNGFGVVAMPFLLYHLVDLGYLAKEENQMGYGDQEDATARFAITGKGKEILRRFFPYPVHNHALLGYSLAFTTAQRVSGLGCVVGYPEAGLQVRRRD
ncbi:MAG: HNH endonuclease [Bryobacteraceae bacterium]|nr:HNH endonuclease [Bryobacteraceae bacterium]